MKFLKLLSIIFIIISFILLIDSLKIIEGVECEELEQTFQDGGGGGCVCGKGTANGERGGLAFYQCFAAQ